MTTNLDALSGVEMFKEISEDYIQGETIVDAIQTKVYLEGGWGIKGFTEEILASGNLFNVTIRLPEKQPFKKCKIAINAVTSHLLIKVGKQWWQTGYTIDTHKIELIKI